MTKRKYGGVLLFAMLAMLAMPLAAYGDHAGEMRYNSTTQRLEFHDGSEWYNFGLGITLGLCNKEGALEFDNLLATYQMCNGTFWIKIVGIPTLSPCSKKGAMDFNGSTFLVCNGLVWTNIKGGPVS
ncbi:MAG: hypothetical protein ACK4NR_05480 [Micavibrio sp.]